LLSARRLKFLSLALLMSGGTVVLTQQWLHEAVRKASVEAAAKASPAAAAAGPQVLVAATALPAGAIVKPGQVRWQAWPVNAPTAGYFTGANAKLDQMNGAIVRSSVDAGEPLTASRIVQPGERGFLAAVLQPGYRAVTVTVTASTGVAGFVMPGDRVDLILSRSLEGGGPQRRFVSETVLQDVRVLAMDQRAAQAKKDVTIPQTATLEVTPKGAEIIAVTSQVGPLSLSLRSLAEPQAAVSQARLVTHTSDAEATQVAAARPAPVHHAAPSRAAVAPQAVVQVFRGAQSSLVSTGGAS